MILFWNQKEVYVGSAMKDFNRVRNTLESNNIKYKYRVVNRNDANVLSSGRYKTDINGQTLEKSYTYYVYVHKSNYEEALALLGI